MANNSIRIFDDLKNFAEEFCLEFISEINSKLLNGNKINIALSGGTTPKLIFQMLVSLKEKPDWKKIHLFWGDERCVPPENAESNFGMTKKYLLDYIEIPSENVHRIKGENNPYKEAERYSGVIMKNLKEINGLPSFEIMILGLGEDGHTASIFPHQMELLTAKKNCEVALHPLTKQKRITITGNVINNSKKIYFLVTGKKKSSVVDKIINKKNNYLTFSASYIKPVYGEIIWFLDKDAASEINS